MMACPEGQVGEYPNCMDPPPTDDERIAAAQGRADTAATNARADADAAAMLDHQDDADVAAAVKAAEDAASAAELARDLADAATNPDAAEALATQAETAEGNADTALANAMMASTAAQAAMDRAAMIAAATKAAETKEKAIAMEAGQSTDASLGGTARTDADGTTTSTDTSDDVYSLSISRDRDGTEVKITDPDMAGADDPKFAQAMDLGGGRTMHSRTMKAGDDGDVESEVVIVSTDIEAPKATAFAKVTGQALDVLSRTGVAAVAPEVDNALSIVEDTVLTGAANANLMFARSAIDGALNYSQDNPGTDPTPDVDEGLHDGTYNGAEGTYRCTATAACTVTFNAKGQVVGNSAGWVFIPDKGATSDVPDSDYLHYGVWLKKTTDSDDAVTYNEVETFAGSSIASSGDVSSVRGSATYNGGAVGVYVHEMVNPDGSRASATSGHFSADVELTATFDQAHEGDNPADTSQPGTIAPNMLNTVTGTIDNFDLSGGEANTWSVALSGDITASSGEVSSGMAKGGVGDGSLSATFHGSVAAATDGSIPKPSSVVGEFNAGFTNGSVAGAFGAREVKED